MLKNAKYNLKLLQTMIRRYRFAALTNLLDKIV